MRGILLRRFLLILLTVFIPLTSFSVENSSLKADFKENVDFFLRNNVVCGSIIPLFAPNIFPVEVFIGKPESYILERKNFFAMSMRQFLEDDATCYCCFMGATIVVLLYFSSWLIDVFKLTIL
ncbi:MAG: hypothetical protein WHS77_06700 [Brevinematales bacterium]